MSRLGVCSRRQAEKMIAKGLVFVDNKKIHENSLVSSDNHISIFSKDENIFPVK
jgi:16S rRNA U516 pseudouridylate synthase RsuA-like enzyme